MRAIPCLISVLALAALAVSAARAELPLPDVTLYGKITTKAGAPVTSGSLTATVKRGAVKVLDAAGEFKSGEGAVFYVVRIPMETNIGAPGPSGAGAREGDTLDALSLEGAKLELGATPPALKAGAVSRIDAVSSASGAPVFIRGDCNADKIVDISDAVRTLNFLFLEPVIPPCLEACNSDGSKDLDISDPVYLLTFLFLSGAAPPAPFPACGTDAKPSAIGCLVTVCPR